MADTDTTAATAADPAPAVQPTESATIQTEEKTNGDIEPKQNTNGAANGKEERYRDRRGGRGGFKNKRREKDDFDNLEESDNPVDIRNQVEFYFSTQNLVTDEHMFHEMEGPKNRPVSIKHITAFKRMRHFKPYSAVVNALRESEDLVVVEDGEFSGTGNEGVKRKVPLVVPTEDGDEDRKPTTTELFHRLKRTSQNKLESCIYAKGFGDLDEAGQIALEQFFRPYGSIMVRKRRDEDNAWKGSVFVEFDSEDSQKQFLALDPKPKFKDNELMIMSKKDYIIMKCKEKGIEPDFDGKKQNSSRAIDRHRAGERGFRRDNRNRRSNYHGGRRDRNRDGSNGPVDETDWNNRRDRFQQGKDDKGTRKEIERDADGVPVVKDTRNEAELAAADKKRKATDEEGAENTKKAKVEGIEEA